jgi:hypothetical protein
MPIVIDKRATPWVCFEIEEDKLDEIIGRYRAQNLANARTVIVADARAVPLEEDAPTPAMLSSSSIVSTSDEQLALLKAIPGIDGASLALIDAEMESRKKRLSAGDGPSVTVVETDRKKK